MSIQRLLDFGQLRGNPFRGTTALDADPGPVLLRPEGQFQRARSTRVPRVPVCAAGEFLEGSTKRNLQADGREGGFNCFLHFGENCSSW